jgi:hypothetical protein
MSSVEQHQDAERLRRAAQGLPIDVHDDAIVAAYERRAKRHRPNSKRASKAKRTSR